MVNFKLADNDNANGLYCSTDTIKTSRVAPLFGSPVFEI